MDTPFSARTAAGGAAEARRLPLWIKLVYGTGDWGMSSFGTLRQVFYAIFLTDVVGLEPRLASIAALVGIVWDAINDPIVGTLSDRIRTRWGRRRPFLLLFAIPYGLGFLLLWWAPPWHAQLALAAHVTLAFMISDTLQTLVVVPFQALTPELASEYDERTALIGYRMFFNLLASLATAVAAPIIVNVARQSGATAQQGYLIVAALFGGLASVPFLAIGLTVRERPAPTAAPQRAPLRDMARAAWRNVPFRYATALYMLNWVTFDLIALILPYYLTYWVAQGDMLASVNVLGEPMALGSAVLGLMLVVAVLSLPLWIWMARRYSKRTAYIAGMAFWALVQCAITVVQPGQLGLIMALAVLAGLSVATAHVLPDAIFPDVIEWDELYTHRRNEGLYYGAKNLIRKLTGAIAIFIALQALGWFGYRAPAADVTFATQSPATLTAIRFLTGPAGAVLLVSAITVAWFYPLTRERHARVQRLLRRRYVREAHLAAMAVDSASRPR